MQYVEHKGKKIEVINQTLNLGNRGICDISEVKGLKSLNNLRILNLSGNKIKEIKGLENLFNLERLFLSNNQITEIKGLDTLQNLIELELDNNKITEFKGLENLTSLNELAIGSNPLPKSVYEEMSLPMDDKKGRIDDPYFIRDIFNVKKAKKDKLEKDSIEKIKKVLKVSTRFRLDMMKDILEINETTFNEKIIYWAKKYGFEIDGDFLIIKKKTISKFIDELERQFEIWEIKEKEKIKKIKFYK